MSWIIHSNGSAAVTGIQTRVVFWPMCLLFTDRIFLGQTTEMKLFWNCLQAADERARSRISAAATGQLGKLLEASRLQQVADFRPLIDKIAVRKDKGRCRDLRMLFVSWKMLSVKFRWTFGDVYWNLWFVRILVTTFLKQHDCVTQGQSAYFSSCSYNHSYSEKQWQQDLTGAIFDYTNCFVTLSICC